MKDIQQRLLATFAIEHRDHVEQIRALLVAIEGAGQPAAGPELDEAFRRAHSLKGAARAVDLGTVEGLAHRLETLFSRVRQGERTLTRDTGRVVEQVLDASEDCVSAIGQPGDPPSAGVALQAMDQILSATHSPQPLPAAQRVEQPPIDTIPAFQAPETMRITAQNFDGFFRSAGGLISETARQAAVAEALQGMSQQVELLEKESARMRRLAPRTGLGRLAASLDSMERHTRSVSRQMRAVRHVHHRHSWNLRQLSQQLREEMGQARLVPAETVLEGFRRMMGDLARDTAREVEFRIVGAQVNADRRVLEALKDPLRHILRNAVSHGIEPAAERVKKGKAPAGLIALRIEATGARLAIEVEDDGGGIDLERITAIAVRDGLLAEGDVARRSPQELHQLLFRPGFSTAASVTNLAGRGMGLSVVHEAIRRLQGDLNIAPSSGGGTRITLSVPLSIASHRLMVVVCGEGKFAIPLIGIERLARVPRTSIETAEGKPVVAIAGRTLPLASLHGLLGIEHPAPGTEPEMLSLVILRSGAERAAIAVDAILCDADLPIQDFAAAACGSRVTSGVVMDDGSIALVLRPADLIRNAREPGGMPHLLPPKPGKPAPAIAAPSILVVDDSMTTRTLEKIILEAHGYHVRVAVDGVEALMRLRQDRPDLVIADIEMPRLNGFGLVEAMKKDPSLERIPVIIVSSLENREDQERGLALGADAYIIKRKFDQEDLLAAIRQIL